MNAPIECRCEEVIITTLTKRGNGVDKTDPIRKITQVWTKDGFLIAENDPCVRAHMICGTETISSSKDDKQFRMVPLSKEMEEMDTGGRR